MNHASSLRARIVQRRSHVAVLTACLLAFGATQHAAAETEREYCERQQGSAKVVCLRDLDKNAKPAAGASSPSAAQAAAPTGAKSMPATASTSTASDADRAYCERQQGSARVVCMRNLDKAPAAPKAVADRAPEPKAAESMPAAAKPAAATKAATAPQGAAPYKVVDGYKVDAETMKGFRAWRAAACDRCHGANQEGLVGPSLISSLKTLTKEEFITVVKNGRLEKGMQSFGNSPVVMDNIDQLYAYLKGRSDGAITKAHVELMQ